MPDGTTYELAGWVDDAVDVKVTSVPDPSRKPPGSFTNEFTTTWTGSGWTEGQLELTTVPCQDYGALGAYGRDKNTTTIYAVPGGQIEISLTDANPSGASLVDDLQLVRVPNASPIRELSLNTSMTDFAWSTRSTFDAGRIPAGAVSSNGSLDPAVVSLTTTDHVAPPGGLGEVLPDANVRLIRPNPDREYQLALEAHYAATPAAQRTGRSTVSVTFTDPATGLSTTEPTTVTLNAGSLDNGNFERGGGSAGWAKWTFSPDGTSWGIVDRQRWRYLASYCALSPPTTAPCSTGPTVGPNDADKVLRVSSGMVGYKVTGLEPGAQYVIQANAMGDGSTLRAAANNGHWTTTPIPRWGQVLGQVTIDSQVWAPTSDLVFTPLADDPSTGYLNENDVWIFVWDDDDPDATPPEPPAPQPPPMPVPASSRACALYAAGETCIDDIGVFKASDLGL